MNLEDHIRSQGRATMNTYTPSPDLDDRIVTTTNRRIRQRRQRAIGAMSAGIAALGIAAAVVITRPDGPTVVSPATTPQTSTSQSNNPPSNDPQPTAVVPVTLNGVEGTVPQPAPVTSPPTTPVPDQVPIGTPLIDLADHFYSADGGDGGVEHGLDGSVIRRMPVRDARSNFLSATSGLSWLADFSLLEPCVNEPIVLQNYTGRWAQTVNGTSFVARTVCDGDRYTGWELLRIAGLNLEPEVVFTVEGASASGATNAVTDALISPNGTLIATEEWTGGEGFVWTLRDLVGNPGAIVQFPGVNCVLYDRPAFVAADLAALACRPGGDSTNFTLMMAEIDGLEGRIVANLVTIEDGADLPSSVWVSALTDVNSPVSSPLLVTWPGSPEGPARSGIWANGEFRRLDGMTGIVAWSLAELGLEVIPPAERPIDHTVQVTVEAPAVAIKVKTSVDLGAATGSEFSRINRFEADGTGALLSVDPATGSVTIVEPNGSMVTLPLEPNHPVSGPINDAAIGPDGVLYVMRGTPDGGAWTLVAHNLDSSFTEIGQWDAGTECVEGWCGNIIFDETGIAVGDGIPYAGNSGAALVDRPYLSGAGETILQVDCADPTQSGFYGAWGMIAATENITWRMEVGCTGVAEGQFGEFDAQADGSIVARVSVSAGINAEGQQRLIWLRADGEALIMDPAAFGPIFDVAVVDGVMSVVHYDATTDHYLVSTVDMG